MKQGQTGVYNLYKLGRLSGNSFDRTIKVLERGLHVVHHDYADKINGQSEMNGLLYEEVEKATALYYDGKDFKNLKVAEPKKVEVVEEESFTGEVAEKELTREEHVEALRKEFKARTGKDAKPLWGVVKLTEEISKL